ncbi:MAG: LptF/LptG family permease [Pleurocapsa sp.]
MRLARKGTVFLNLKLALIDRYILSELITFFLFSVGLFSSLGVAIGTISDLAYKTSEYNLPIAVAVLIFIYKIPEYIAYALPISILLTTLIIYGRLSSDRELIALGSVGINIYRIIAPALVFSLVVTVATFIFNELIVPSANYQANLVQTPFIPDSGLNLQKRDIFYPEYEKSTSDSTPKSLQKIYYAERFDGRNLRDITILSWQKGKLKQIITAHSATWNESLQLWELSKGKIDNLNDDNTIIASKKFQHKALALSSTIFSLVNQKRSPDDMNIGQAKKYLNLIAQQGQRQEIALFKVRIQQKIAFPFICLVFAIIGAAIGTSYNQINKSKGFGLCVAIVFIYYFLGFAIGSLGIVGILSPFLAAWLPNFLCLAMGVKLLTSANN